MKMKQVNELMVTTFNEDRITDRNQSRGGLESLHLPFVLLCLSLLAKQNNKKNSNDDIKRYSFHLK